MISVIASPGTSLKFETFKYIFKTTMFTITINIFNILQKRISAFLKLRFIELEELKTCS